MADTAAGRPHAAQQAVTHLAPEVPSAESGIETPDDDSIPDLLPDSSPSDAEAQAPSDAQALDDLLSAPRAPPEPATPEESRMMTAANMTLESVRKGLQQLKAQKKPQQLAPSQLIPHVPTSQRQTAQSPPINLPSVIQLPDGLSAAVETPDQALDTLNALSSQAMQAQTQIAQIAQTPQPLGPDHRIATQLAQQQTQGLAALASQGLAALASEGQSAQSVVPHVAEDPRLLSKRPQRYAGDDEKKVEEGSDAEDRPRPRSREREQRAQKEQPVSKKRRRSKIQRLVNDSKTHGEKLQALE